MTPSFLLQPGLAMSRKTLRPGFDSAKSLATHTVLGPGSFLAARGRRRCSPCTLENELENRPMTTSTAMTRRLTIADVRVPALLLALSLVPTLGGAARLLSVASNRAITPDDARFLDAPVPVVVHVLSATLYCWLGAFRSRAASGCAGQAGIATRGGCSRCPGSSRGCPGCG